MIRSKPGQFGDVKVQLHADIGELDAEQAAEVRAFLDKCMDAILFYGKHGFIPLTGSVGESRRDVENLRKLRKDKPL